MELREVYIVLLHFLHKTTLLGQLKRLNSRSPSELSVVEMEFGLQSAL